MIKYLIFLLFFSSSLFADFSIVDPYTYLPKLTQTEIDLLAPLPGSFLYNKDTNLLSYYNGTAWVILQNAGGSPSGDVFGPNSSITNNLAIFSNTTGKLLSDSLVPYTNLVTTTNNFTNANHLILSNSTNKTIKEVLYTMPTAVCTTGQALKSDGTNITCQTDALGGDVNGPASSTDNYIAVFSGTTGKIIKDSGKLVTNAVFNSGVSTTSNIPMFSDATGKLIADSSIAVSTIVTMASNGALNRPLLSGGANTTAINANYTIPTTIGTNGQVLSSDGTNVTFQANNTAGPWQTCTGANGFGGTGSVCSVRLMEGNTSLQINIYGSLSITGSTSPTTICTCPVGYRPTHRCVFPMATNSTNANMISSYFNIDGTIQFNYNGTLAQQNGNAYCAI